LFITATSVPSERVFSKAGKIVNKFRCNLKSENISMLVFLKCNNNHRFNDCKEEIKD
jgi:hypothetical protein